MSRTNIQRKSVDRILIIDDDRSVHDAYRKALGVGESADSSLQAREGLLFGESIRRDDDEFQVDSAYQGQEGLQRIREAAQSGRPYAMAFVDMRMPPGLDGLETISRIWEEFPGFQIVLCSAYSDYSWNETIERVGRTSDLLILKKPFEVVEIRQVACALVEKAHLKRQADLKMQELELMVQQRSSDLERLCTQLHVANTKLVAAKEAAEVANHAKSEFIANMSHARSARR